MLVVAAVAVPRRVAGQRTADSIEAAHAASASWPAAARRSAFAVALLASGLSSSSVGTYAGQVVMQGFIAPERPAVPAPARVTMLPALVVLGLGLPATDSLVVSQVVLSFGIPFALVPLSLLTRRAGRHGRVRQPPGHHLRGGRRGGDHRAERLPARQRPLSGPQSYPGRPAAAEPELLAGL